MKLTYYYLIGLLTLVSAISSCKKTEDVINPTTSITVYNAMSDGSVVFSDFYQTGKLSFSSVLKGIPAPLSGSIRSYLERGLSAGTVPISLYAFPDSIKPIVKISRDYKPAGIYSQFVCGTKTAVDTLFTVDKIPSVSLADSVLLVRFVNLSKLTVPVSVNISGKTAPIAGVESLKYKQITDFLKISVKSKDMTGDNLIIQVRNATTGALITTNTYVWRGGTASSRNTNMAKPSTLIITSSGNATITTFIPPKL